MGKAKLLGYNKPYIPNNRAQRQNQWPRKKVPRVKKLDNLEKDVVKAMELGYGVHYGHYKADHPYTRVEEPLIVNGLPTDMIPCRHCGKLFAAEESGHTKSARFCSDDCRRESTRIRQQGYYQAKMKRRLMSNGMEV